MVAARMGAKEGVEKVAARVARAAMAAPGLAQAVPAAVAVADMAVVPLVAESAELSAPL
jgi:hypothetical protein